MRNRRIALLGAVTIGVTVLVTACSSASAGPGGTRGGAAVLMAVGAENEYADVIRQIGGKYVRVAAIMSNPNTDPHTFEASASVAAEVRDADLVVQNGLGYDDFMATIEKASPNAGRQVVDVHHLRGLPDSTPNPHLWYDPATMPAVAKALVADLSRLQPAHAAYFHANDTTFENSLRTWQQQLTTFRQQYPNTRVATTEPVADYLLEAAGIDNVTPFALQAAIMNGTDPAPQAVSAQTALCTGHQVKAFVYNQQVTDDLTQNWLAACEAAHIPVVGVYETMPTSGYTYQTWMEAELHAIRLAVTEGTSTDKL
jgi:zinc/manganese transport system substrate-binding protein